MPAAIEEEAWHAGQGITLQGLVDSGRPRVLRGLCRDWPIVQLARESDEAFAHYLARHDKGAPVDVLRIEPGQDGVVGYNAELTGFNYKHFHVSVTQVLERLAHYSSLDDPPGLAMQSALLSTFLPSFAPLHPNPLLAANIPPRLWMGNKVTTPAHFDGSYNIAVVVCGRRRFTLFPPEQVSNLYVGPLDFAPTAAAISLARLDASADPRYPRLKDALAQAQVAVLEPGDAIYMPPVWWHHVESLERLNALVNYWWGSAAFPGHVAEPPQDALMHCILAFKSMPPAERAGWKVLLDHYVFGDEDPAAHIPPELRGVLGPLTPELVAKLKQLIRR